MKKIIKLLFMYMLLSACTPKAQSITYGADMCHFCKMNIVDVQHASEIVTKKGKVFKYDAIECMLNSEEHQAPEKNALYLPMCMDNPRYWSMLPKLLISFQKGYPVQWGQSYCL